ncbi:MAG: PD-(D/E)XK nuclease family protein, partial [Vicinamibacterales bacterium]
ARYAELDDIAIVGLVDAEWPDRQARNIFSPSGLLKALGWPSESTRRRAADARFLDLLGSASDRVTVSTVTLDDDAIVMRSMQLDEIPRARLSTVPVEPARARISLEDALAFEPPVLDPLEARAREWAALRLRRTAIDSPAYHGTTGPRPPRPWSVSALEAYLACPFKFFAQHVLRIDEEPEDSDVMDPRQQGQFVHAVFETFFERWGRAGGGTITPETLDAAREVFAAVVEERVATLPEAEAGLERTRLLGSSAAAGLGEAVLRMEAERPQRVVERLLEQRLDCDLHVTTDTGPRIIPLKGKADRIDLLEDGTFRLIDYKLGWPPQRSRALQLPIYALAAEQRLADHRGRSWTLGEAAYLAFKGPRRVVPLYSAPGDREKVMLDAQQRAAAVIDGIAQGEFPPRPDDVYLCETCSFAAVCRKDYVGDV